MALPVRWRRDMACIALLVLICLVFFWRLLTPFESQRMALVEGDFSAQFFAFGGYQYARFSAGEVPLWNPYNNGGLPFIADTQAAVFYPPRLLTLALASLSGGWTYHALELEMVAHVLVYTLLLYAFLRRLTLDLPATHAASLIGAVVGGYGGYLTGYPPLQLGLLESGIWLPLAALGITEATRGGFRWRWLLLTGFALGLSWMAGHPQTSFFLTYLLGAYFAYRVYAARLPVMTWLAGMALFGLLSVGLVAVTLLPSAEYLLLTSRANFSYAELSHGFPVGDLIQIFLPAVVSQWSPLWVGLSGLALALAAIYYDRPRAIFWAGLALFALLFSLGGNGPLYPLLFDVVPGLHFFRGQERIAYLYANAAAILAAIGAAHLLMRVRLRPALLVALVVAELLIIGLQTSPNYTTLPVDRIVNHNPLLDPVLADTQTPFRVDGLRVLGGNWGSYHGIADIQGISPLFLAGVQDIIEDGLPDERAWELFAVRYVYSAWEALTVPAEIIARGGDDAGEVSLHRLLAERPFAHFVYDVQMADTDDAARELLAQPDFNPRLTGILHASLPLDLPMQPIEYYGSTVTRHTPEHIEIVAETPDNALLSLALVDYPGWYATIDGQSTPLVRAYGGLTALAFPAGQHTVTLRYDPLSYRIGAVVSAVTWFALALTGAVFVIQAWKWRRA